MQRALIRYQIRRLFSPAVLAVVMGNMVMLLSIMLGARMWQHQSDGPQTLSWLPLAWLLVIWSIVAWVILWPSNRKRCTEFMMVLPITWRSVVFSHTVAVMALACTLIATAMILLIAGNFLMYGWVGAWIILPSQVVWSTALLLMTALAFTALIHAWRPADTISGPRRSMGVGSAYILSCATLFAIWQLHPILGLLPAAAGLWLLGRRVKATAVPGIWHAQTPMQAVTFSSFSSLPQHSVVWTRWMIWRSLHRKPWAPIFLWAIVFGFSMILAGVYGTLFGNSVMRFSQIPLFIYTLMAMWAPALQDMPRIDALPISRNLILATVWIPVLLVSAVGYFVGTYMVTHRDTRPSVHFVETEEGHHALVIPFSHTELVHRDRIPMLISPQGESHAPASRTPIYPESPWVLISPYSTPKGASLDFAAWQFQRAVEAIYGVHLEAETLKRTYLAEDAQGRVVTTHPTSTLLQDFPQLREPGDDAAPVIMVLIIAGWALISAGFLRACRARHSDLRRRIAYWGILGGLLFLHLFQFVAAIAGWIDLDVIESLWIMGIHACTNMLPFGPLTLWLASLATSWGCLAFLSRQFHAVELPHSSFKLGLCN